MGKAGLGVLLLAGAVVACTNSVNGGGPGGGGASPSQAPQQGNPDTFWYEPSAVSPEDFLSVYSIESETPGFTADTTGRWATGGSATQIETIVSHQTDYDLVKVDRSSEIHLYTFFPSGQYGILYMLQVDGSSGVFTERGTYAFSGSQVTLTPSGVKQTISINGNPPTTEVRSAPARVLSVSAAVYRETTSRTDDGIYNTGMVLRGACAPYESSTGGTCEHKLQRLDGKPTNIASPRWLGQSCNQNDKQCRAPFQCDTSAPGGTCTRACSENRDCGSGYCVQGACYAYCLSSGGKQCRTGYKCYDAGVSAEIGVCAPE